MPGVLPVLNKQFLESSMKACLATHCTVTPMNRFARKNYFYPDLPKGYQISQYEIPIVSGGCMEIITNGKSKSKTQTFEVEFDKKISLNKLQNITGISKNRVCEFLEHVHLNSDFEIFLFQEFDSSMEYHELQTSCSTVFVAPGLSSKSRSNAIMVHSKWMPFFKFVCHCAVGLIVFLCFGGVFEATNAETVVWRSQASLTKIE